ncbi:MAG: hypothetical protein JSV33_05500 [bacterium]|nr:MAG: hypothetical protein JSV33_05500 [bacterium]
MVEGFIVRPLRCNHCGKELPVMGRFVAFQCGTCFNHWVLTSDGLKPVHIFRVSYESKSQEDVSLLPFWVIEVDLGKLRSSMESSFEELCVSAQTILQTRITPEQEEPEFEILPQGKPGIDKGLLKAQFLVEASKKRKFPSSAEFNHLIGRLEEKGRFFVYVPAFLSFNTYAYLKIGRLLTKLQPTFGVEKSGDRGGGVLCAMQADEAVSLMDFIFLAILPDSIQSYGDLLEKIHLTPVGRPQLIEFPFVRQGAYLVSKVGGFQISKRLIEGLDGYHAPEHTTA